MKNKVKAVKWGLKTINLHRLNEIYDDEVRTAQKYLYKGVLHLYGVSESRLHPTVNTVKIYNDGTIKYYRNKKAVAESWECDMLLEALTAGLI